MAGRGISARAARSARRGFTGGPTLLILGSGALVIGAGWWVLGSLSPSTTARDLLTHTATRGSFVHDVVERGELESSKNISVRCEVQARGAGVNGVKIIEIVPEGTVVKQGDFLIKFDDSTLQTDRTTQQINVSSAEAAAAQSANDLESAIFTRQEYEFGEFETEKEKLNGEILVASEMRSRAIDQLAFRKRQARNGYMTESDVRSADFDLKKYSSELRTAQVKLNALVKWTRLKKIKELDAKTKTCEAKLQSDEAKLALENQKLAVLDDQIAKCTVVAPGPGQVIYDHEQDQWRGAEFQIKQGAVVHEQRVVIRLPDPKQMQVIAKVAESRIDLIKVGMPATIEIEGLPGTALRGKVTKVNEYPAPENWFNSNVKEYATTVVVDAPPSGLRPGMTAKVAIRVETLDDALQVPVQAVVERGGKHYCLLAADGRSIERREVLTGATNEKFIVIRDGLGPNDSVVLNPRAHLAAVNLDDATVGAETKVAKQDQDKKSQRPDAPRPAPPAGGPGS
jgi:HlyD family secretion protein